MSRVCVVFDRLRTEEKMLQKEAESLGHDTVMLDAKTTILDTHEAANSFDVVLERCVSYFRGLHFTAHLEFSGAPVVNPFSVASMCGNKMFMTLALKKHNVPTPKTHFAFTREGAQKILDRTGYPMVIKPVIGSWGRGVVPLRDEDTADAIFETREITDGPYDRIYYLQEMINRPPRDIRVITIDCRPVAAMYRSAPGFKTNLAIGGQQEPCPITDEIGEIASKASEAVGGGVLGVDIMEDESRGLVVHEVNNTTEFKGISQVVEANIPSQIVRFAIDYSKR